MDQALDHVLRAETLTSALPVPIMLPPAPQSASVARSLLRNALRDHLPPDTLADVELLSTELVSNAVAASADPCVISVTVPEPDVVRISVADTTRRPPITSHPDLLSEGGRGMQILERLALRWGIEPGTPAGKVVWFEVSAASTV